MSDRTPLALRRPVAALAVGIASFTLIVAPLRAQVIGIFAQDGGTCIELHPGAPVVFNILFVPGGDAPAMSGAEFRVAGFVTDNVFLNVTPQPITDLCMMGCDVFGVGVSLGYPSCQTGTVLLFQVSAFAVGPVPPMELEVVGRTVPSNPDFPCPHVTLCDPPTFTRVCVTGGTASVNACEVGVAARTWSQVRALYAGR